MLLLEGLRANDELSFRRLYKDYSPALLGIIFRIVKQEEEAEDVLQETFINISRNILLYDSDKSGLFTWMAKVATNKALDYIRSAPVRREGNRVDIIDLEQDYVDEFHINCLNIETIGIKELTSILKPIEWQVIDLMYFQGYTQTEVAEELNIPLGTVKTRARMAIIELRKQFIRHELMIRA
ncbi:RNA polymerase sigma factor [Pedobacter sp. L105]|uniref:RNA polymerase sigma factor n=1 Tax=Pedobacter sp. L105 TaxID=1641871 RepID=UPI00131C89B7|nr:sigma-70 family RNA polymerase sigma factor [Pedobacter sp. L105]